MGVNARTFGILFGATYLVLGVVGFVVTGVAEPAAGDTGDTLIGLELNAVHNLVHILIGAALFLAALAGDVVARQIVLLLGAVNVVVGIGGFFVLERPEVNVLAVNVGDNVLHIVSGLLAVAVVAAERGRLAPASLA